MDLPFGLRPIAAAADLTLASCERLASCQLLRGLANLSLACGVAAVAFGVPAVVGLPLGVATYTLANRNLDRMGCRRLDPRGRAETWAAWERAGQAITRNLLGPLACLVLWCGCMGGGEAFPVGCVPRARCRPSPLGIPCQNLRTSSSSSCRQPTQRGKRSRSRPATRPAARTGRSAGRPQRQQG
jgi:hypothetical protein